ncbi:Fic family protein [Enterococcus faecalis]|uniref:Fic family protein n=1 Tax=Enterococcus faecalis TaxID=1351 RepID=UPI003D6B93CA
MDNTALAKFITSLGSLNNYGSTVLQTKKALDQKSVKPLRQNQDDIAIFTDTLKGIAAVKEIGFNTEGIIAINKQFDSISDEQPNMPGHLRNAYYNSDDQIAIIIDEGSQDAYFPPEVISRTDLDNIVNDFEASGKKEEDAWRVFVRISKLQPFQDGNKRTALIAANAAMNTFENENYLTLPFNDLDRVDFTTNLMRYYQAKTPESENEAFKRLLSTLPSKKEREHALREPIEEKQFDRAKTYKIKSQLRKKNIDNR